MSTEGTVAGQLLKWSKDDSDRLAYIFRGTQPGNNRVVFTRYEILQLACCFAAELHEAGVKKGDVICNTLANSPERLITDLGLMVAGAVTMNGMVFLADGADLAKCLFRGNCVAMVLDPNQPNNALTILEDRIIVRGDNAQCREAPSLRKVFFVDCGAGAARRPWLEQLRQKEEKFTNTSVRSTDMAFVFTTSGTSGFSKLVPRTHRQFLILGGTFYDVMEARDKDLIFNDRSFGWLGGSCFTYLAKGTTRVLIDMTVPPPDALAFAWECVFAEQCAVLIMVPPHISMSLAKPDLWKDKKPRVRSITTGGMPLSKQHVSSVGTLCDQLVITYASTEGGFITKNRITMADKDNFEDGDNGKSTENYTLKIVNDKGMEIAQTQVGKSGEVLIKGNQTFEGYLGTAEADMKEMFTDGWLKTSDIGYYNPQGNIHVVCRKSNAIMHGAYIVYPGWLEKKLEKCPGVKQVMIVPVPDPTMYQEMCACIVPADGQQVTEMDLKTFCDSLFSIDKDAEYKTVPKYYVFFDHFPMQSSGNKPDRKKIFAKALEKLNLTPSAS
ncbi:3-[(3aS,4S,7aS)-7a-methyl-1,5-dioxo-octahydro-1H-inden-4-yl]propanoyl:CoA ligase-like [Littorina saxatilis]|uniref:Uncharacterized protein n=1 Tax=Littorina saxatilis TaxID=31220 RepID=A0AAN9BEV1_9CAEN